MTAAYGSSTDQGLATKREQYKYNHVHIPPLAMVDTLPEAEQFSTPWKLMLAKVGFQLLVNKIIVNYGDQGDAGAADDVKAFLQATLKETLAKYKGFSKLKIIFKGLKFVPRLVFGQISTDVKEVEDLMQDIIKTMGRDFLEDFAGDVMQKLTVDAPQGRCTTIKEFKELFATIDLPEIAYTFQEDETFAYMRVAGPNSVMLQRMTEPDPRFPVTEAHYQTVMGEEDSLASARAEGRLYLCDYGILEGAVNGSFPTDQKYLYAPLALFAVPKGDRRDRKLHPVAIQCGQKPKKFPILTPQSNHYAWLCAKTAVQIADVNFHEAVTHLARTHLFMGPFAIAPPVNYQRATPFINYSAPISLGCWRLTMQRNGSLFIAAAA